jgi:D-alanyl-D-alanine carboxypeptidase
MQFQGNFFIHGWPYHPDGTPVADGFSGGCIRLNSEDAEQIFNLANTNIPVLIFKESFNASTDGTTYEKQKVVLGNASYLAADIENNFVFAENKLGEERSIASIVKLLTALVAVEYINVERIANVDDSMEIETSIPRIESGDSYTVLDLLSILLMESSNRAALAIADVLGEARFVRLMNDKVDAIGMKDTRVADTSGVLGSNVSTPEDLFMLLKYLYHNRSFVLDMSVGKERRAVYGPSDFGNVASLNEIPGTVGIIGGKSGKSTSAKDSMVSVFEMKIGNKNRPVAIIVLGSDDSKRDVKLIYDHIRDNFEITSN